MQLPSVALAVLLVAPVSIARADRRAGVVVSKVEAGGAADRAGLKPGNVIRSWSGPGCAARCPIDSPFELQEAQDQGARGPVKLFGAADGRDTSWSLEPKSWNLWYGVNDWELEARPQMSPRLVSLYEEGRELQDRAYMEQRAQVRSPLAGVTAIVRDSSGRWCQGAEEADRAGDVEAARFFRVEAARHLPKEPRTRETLYRRAMEGAPPRWRARFLAELAALTFGYNDWYVGEAGFEEALALYQRLDPDGIGAARCLRAIGILETSRVSPVSARHDFELAIAIHERLAPDSLALAGLLTDLASSVHRFGDLDAAERAARRAQTILTRVAPASDYAVLDHFVLALIQAARGDLAGAEDTLRRVQPVAQAFSERIGAGHLMTDTWNKLGDVLYKQGELAEAQDHFRKALANTERWSPGDEVLVALSLSRLGSVARERGDLARAASLFERCLEIFQRLNPEGQWNASTLMELAALLDQLGDPQGEEALIRRALGMRVRISADSLEEAESRSLLALLAYRRGDLLAAEEEGLLALAIQEGRAPGSSAQATTLHRLGMTYWKEGRRGDAADALCRSVEALESQTGRVGGTHMTRATFAARFADLYRDYIALLLELGREGDAFRVLERSRARAFLSMLGERDISFSADIPIELAVEARRIGQEYDALLLRLATSSEEARDDVTARLQELQRQAELVATQVRERSPRLAALRESEPLAVSAARESLDPGTVLLSYSVGRERSTLFVVTGTGLTVLPVDVSQTGLRRQVDRFRNLIEAGRSSREPSTGLLELGHTLFTELIGPALPWLADARRILISPDGPLHELPFAALVRAVTPTGGPSYLAAWKPVHTVLSASVYAELRKSTWRGSKALDLAAFGDPKYPESVEGRSAMADPEVRSALRRGLELVPLPGTREEVEGIFRLYDRRAVEYLGEEATEERAKSVGTDVQYLHFACHAVLDERSPLSSALVLSIPQGASASGRENGLLQAWEILNGMRIDADLVTLSACQTALGQEIGGEGLVGLTRAFQYAGARAVLASLWRVSDEATGELMKRFYAHLKSGEAKDEALRSAQLELLRAPGGRFAHPFAWAAFQLDGDPR